MLLSLTEAKKYVCEKVEQITMEKVSDDERTLVEASLEQMFFDKIDGLLSDEEIEGAQIETPDQLDAYMFNNIPNYATLLEETTAEFLSDYLSVDSDDNEDAENTEDIENNESK